MRVLTHLGTFWRIWERNLEAAGNENWLACGMGMTNGNSLSLKPGVTGPGPESPYSRKYTGRQGEGSS